MKANFTRNILFAAMLLCFVTGHAQDGIWTASGASIYTSNSNNVGVGTFSPDRILTIKGKVHAEELNINLAVAGPDYVFKDDYPLMPVSELEAYVKTHSHLPEVPSAEELKEEGLNISEMSMLMLKKTEELTLYILSHEKRIKALESTNNKQHTKP